MASLTNGPTTVTAHSLGNMVALSALSDFGAPIEKYFMLDAAVALEAIDGGASQTTNMIYPDWLDYTPRLYASEWFRIFDVADGRSTLTWSNRLANVPLTNIYNFYSSGEEVLREYTGGEPPHDLLSSIPETAGAAIQGAQGLYAWAWQEKAKGRAGLDGFLGSTHGGWRFNSAYNDAFGNHMPPTQAALLPNSQLQTNAFFQVHSPTLTADLALQGANGSQYAQTSRNRILADAIPALTLPVGANPASKLSPPQSPVERNFDMNVRFQNGWPAGRSSGGEAGKWHHSDVRVLAYTFTYKLFDDFVVLGNLQ